MGQTFADFHCFGNLHTEREYWKSVLSGSAISRWISFRNLLLMLSGPDAFPVVSALRTEATSSVVMLMKDK